MKQARRPPKDFVSRTTDRVVPQRRSWILLESALILGLTEGMMWNVITNIHIAVYYKAILLMAGVVGIFALAVRVLEPIIAALLNFISRLDKGEGALLRLGFHLVILFLIYVSYVRVFFKNG